MINVELNGADAIRAGLAAIPADARSALRRASEDLADQIRSAAESNLSGGVLEARSGKLRDSLAIAATVAGSQIRTAVEASVPYAAFQEYGFSGTESVHEFLRRQSMVFGRTVTPKEVRVRAHDRRVDYPGRSYLCSALADIAPSIREVLSSAMSEVVGS